MAPQSLLRVLDPSVVSLLVLLGVSIVLQYGTLFLVTAVLAKIIGWAYYKLYLGKKPVPANSAVFVTGCSTGVGRATAVHLASLGFEVFATVRSEEKTPTKM